MATPLRLLFAVALLPLVNCSVNLDIGDNVAISCGADGQCPSGYTCRDSVNRCVPNSATGDGPSLVGTATFDKTLIKVGDTLNVTFTIDRQAIQPAVTFAGPSQTFSMTLVDSPADGSQTFTYVFSYTATGAEPEEIGIDVTAAAVDTSGNVSTLALGKIGFDFTPPSAADFDWQRPKPAFKHDDTLSITGSTEGDATLVAARLLDGSTVLSQSFPATLAAGSFGRQSITGTVDLTALTLSDGDSLEVELDLVDAIGNAITVTTGAALLDFTPPTNPSIVIEGKPDTQVTKVLVDLDASGGATQVYLDGDVLETVNTLKLVPITVPGSLQVQLNVGSGLRTVRAKFADAAGNESTTAQDTINLAVDNISPTVTSFVADSPTITNNPTVQFTLAADDNNGVVDYAVTFTSGAPNASSITTPFPTAQPSVDGSTTIGGADGSYTLYAWVKDGADLISAAPAKSITITLDRVPPTVSTFNVSATAVKTGSVGVTVTGSDAVGLSAQCVNESSAQPAASDPCFVTTASSVSLTGDGSHTLYAWVRDAAGNVSTSSLQRTVFLDTKVPVVAAFTLGVASPASSATIPVTVTASDPAPSSGSLSYRLNESATQPGSCNLPSQPTSYTASGSGNHTIYAWACDPAGNVSAAVSPQSICVDLGAPLISLFQAPQTSVIAGASISGLILHVNDDCGAVRYYISTSSTTPSAGAFTQNYLAAYNTGTSLPDTVTTASTDLGPKLIYAWVLDGAGRISSAASVTVNVTGAEQRADTQDSTRDRSAPQIAMTPTSTSFAVWQDCPRAGGNCDVMGRFFGSNGVPTASEFKINTTAGSAITPDVASCSTTGDYVVVWSLGNAIKAQFFTSSGATVGSEIAVATVATPPSPISPHVAYGRPVATGASPHAADAVVTWQDGNTIYAARPKSDGTGLMEAAFFVGSSSNPAGPVVAAIATGQFMIAYMGDGSDNPDVVVAAYSAAAIQGVVTTANQPTHAAGSDLTRFRPAISMFLDGSAVVAWADTQATPSQQNDIYFSRLASDGTLGAHDLLVAEGQTGLGQTAPPVDSPAVMADPSSDGFFIAWEYYDVVLGGDTYSPGIMSAVFHADNSGNGPAFVVNDTTSSNQSNPGLASNGGSVVYVWQTDQNTAEEIYMKRAAFDLCAGASSCSH